MPPIEHRNLSATASQPVSCPGTRVLRAKADSSVGEVRLQVLGRHSSRECYVVLRTLYSTAWTATVRGAGRTYREKPSEVYGFATGFALPPTHKSLSITIVLQHHGVGGVGVGAALSGMAAIGMGVAAVRRYKAGRRYYPASEEELTIGQGTDGVSATLPPGVPAP